MNRTFLMVALLIGLAMGLTVAVGVTWYFLRKQPVSTPGHEPWAGPAKTDQQAVPGTPPEKNNARAGKFEELDLDRDGKLSLAEFTAGRKPAEAEKWFKLRDANQDGFISREEFLPFSARPKAQ